MVTYNYYRFELEFHETAPGSRIWPLIKVLYFSLNEVLAIIKPFSSFQSPKSNETPINRRNLQKSASVLVDGVATDFSQLP